MTRLAVAGAPAVTRVWNGARWERQKLKGRFTSELQRPYEFPDADPWSVADACITPSYDDTGSMVHPSVIDMTRHGFPEGFRGWRYWMAATPYSGTNNAIENPSILVSNFGWDWRVPHGLTNPIDEWPGSSQEATGLYNSDTELVWDPDGQRFIVYWRRSFEWLHAAESVDGVTWTRHFNVLGTSDPAQQSSLLSPSIVRVGAGDWRMFAISNRVNHGGSANGQIRVFHATGPLGPWTEEPGSIAGITPVPYLWHAAVYLEGGAYRMLANFRSPEWDLRAGTSPDGITWTFGPRFLKDGTTYRSTMQPSDEPGMIDLWYSAQTDSQLGTDWWVKYTRIPASLWDN